MKTPPIKDIEYAVTLYYSKIEIGTSDIMKLFGRGRHTAARYKKIAYDEMVAQRKQNMQHHCVPTKIAFEAWGINIEDLEERLAKLRKLKLLEVDV